MPSVRPDGEPDGAFDVRLAWRRGDPAIEADAVDFWNRLGLLPPGVRPEDRASELIAAAYSGDRLVAVATATIEWIAPFGVNLAVIRGATDPEFRRSRAQLALAAPSRAALIDWSMAHPEERLAGAIAFVEGGEWGDFAKVPVWPGSGLAHAGYDDLGRQVRIAWFEHFRFDQESAPRPLPSGPPAVDPGFELRPAWRREDRQAEADAIAFWTRLGLLPSHATSEDRARELVAVAYRDGRVAGVVTAEVGILPQVRARLAMVRGAVDPELRRSQIGFALLLAARRILEAWSAEHPDEGLAGIGGIVESRDLMAAQSQPYWPVSRFGLIGFTPDGRQIRVSWFDHARVE
jgi:hypothetical protein